jgi:glycosyltransferase involved in cell wall biosynthesis
VSRILVISSYPPRHCGIGEYARAQVERLQGQGHDVTVLSPLDGDGDIRLSFARGRPFWAAARKGGGFDRIVVHFEPGLYLSRRAPLPKMITALSLFWLALRRRQTEILVHEAQPPRWWRPDDVLLALALRAAPIVLFHTALERETFRKAFRFRGQARLIPHTDGVVVHGPRTRREARRRLGIREDEVLVVCPGFLHPDKGFERAVRAFRPRRKGRLCIVGSVRDPTPSNLEYAGRLCRLAEQTRGVDLVDEFVDDGAFDAWIAAADAVVLPYRRSWSSGVLARAQALGTPAIVAAVGGLPEQASAADVVIRNDDELAMAMDRVARSPRRGVAR